MRKNYLLTVTYHTPPEGWGDQKTIQSPIYEVTHEWMLKLVGWIEAVPDVAEVTYTQSDISKESK